MNYFLDCEFIEDGKTIDLISIGIVSEDNRELHLGNCRCQFWEADPWVKSNVLEPMGFARSPEGVWRIPSDPKFWIAPEEIAERVADFMGADLIQPEEGPSYYKLKEGNPEPLMWGECCSYDWVAFCQLFGKMVDIPEGFSMRCRDVIQYCEDHLGLFEIQLPQSYEVDGGHGALLGAKTVKARWEFCRDLDKKKSKSE